MRRALVWALAAWVVLSGTVMAARSAWRAPRAKTVVAVPVDPELSRCQAAGEAAADDQACHAAWRAARQRFLGGTAR